MYGPSQLAVDIPQNVAVSKYKRGFLEAAFAMRAEAALRERKKKTAHDYILVGKLLNVLSNELKHVR